MAWPLGEKDVAKDDDGDDDVIDSDNTRRIVFKGILKAAAKETRCIHLNNKYSTTFTYPSLYI